MLQWALMLFDVVHYFCASSVVMKSQPILWKGQLKTKVSKLIWFDLVYDLVWLPCFFVRWLTRDERSDAYFLQIVFQICCIFPQLPLAPQSDFFIQNFPDLACQELQPRQEMSGQHRTHAFLPYWTSQFCKIWWVHKEVLFTRLECDPDWSFILKKVAEKYNFRVHWKKNETCLRQKSTSKLLTCQIINLSQESRHKFQVIFDRVFIKRGMRSRKLKLYYCFYM